MSENNIDFDECWKWSYAYSDKELSKELYNSLKDKFTKVTSLNKKYNWFFPILGLVLFAISLTSYYFLLKGDLRFIYCSILTTAILIPTLYLLGCGILRLFIKIKQPSMLGVMDFLFEKHLDLLPSFANIYS